MSAPRRSVRRRPDRSQHFLRRGALAARLVERAELDGRDLVVEIGPGTGALTRELARRCARLVAVEVDPDLCRRLRDEFAASGRPDRAAGAVEVVEADFLAWPLPSVPFKVFGNVPFRGSAAIVRRLVASPHPPADAWLVLQREAALRFAGRPWAPETRISLELKPWWHVEIAAHLRRGDFEPPPAVEAAMLWLARRARPLVRAGEARLYRDFVAAAFGRGGATVRDGLAPLLTPVQLARLSRELHFRTDTRPSQLGFEQWLALFRFFVRHAAPGARDRARRERDRASRRPGRDR